MAWDSRAIANEFLALAAESGRGLTPMQLVKLVYIAHGYSLFERSAPLINEPVEAWQYGPVVPKVYHAFKAYGRQPVERPAMQYNFEEDVMEPISMDDGARNADVESARAVIKKVWAKYGAKSGLALSNLTHKPNTPWYEVTNGGVSVGAYKEIPDDVIERHYRNLIALS